jgi:hypothetical protein
VNGRRFASLFGVDFSGARLAGRNIWIARAEPTGGPVPLRLLELHNLAVLAGTAERTPALAHLVRLIRSSHGALWGLDFPFGLPVELFPPGTTWRRQLEIVAGWNGDAAGLGRWCCSAARALGREMHIRRTTDTEARTPFDCYHYRIIWQTVFGMTAVLLPLADVARTAVLPFQYRKFTSADRVITEACPGSVLKRLRLPHQNYKQPAGGPLTSKRRRTRGHIFDGLAPLIEINATLRRRMMRNPGGDALDAAIAAVGAWQRWTIADHAAIRRHPRYRFEGYLFA